MLESLIQARLLDAPAVHDFLSRYRDGLAEFRDADLLGEALVQVGALTPYQLSRALAGTTHGLVLGSYRVLDRLGGGSVGVVFLAEHILLRRRVAVKVVPVDDGFPPSVLERFYAEMRVLAGLHHPNVVLAYDAGRLPAPGPNLPALHFLVMELITGGDLENHVVEHGPPPVPQACEWIRQAAAGLQEAHDNHLVHRDLKPSNLLLTADGTVKLVDFGLARQFYGNKTDPRALLGSIEFMAPEQSLDPTAVNARADIYGLGATLFWVLTGQTPYPQEPSVAKALQALQRDQPRRLRQFLPHAPTEVDELLARMMARDPAQRPASPLEVMAVLTRYAAADGSPGATVDDASAMATVQPATAWRALVAGSTPEVRGQIRSVLEARGGVCVEAATAADADRHLREHPFDVALLDSALDPPGAYHVCRSHPARPGRPHTKVVVHGHPRSPQDYAEAVRNGADDFLPHPLDPTRLAAKVESLLRDKAARDLADRFARQVVTMNRQLQQSLASRARDVRRAQDALLFAMAKMAEARDGESAGHLRRVQQFSTCLAEALLAAPGWRSAVDGTFADDVGRCAPLHDIGKLGLPDAALSRPGPLSPVERRLMQTHTTLGGDIIDAVRREYGEALGVLATARAVVRHHHERWDGTGYPDRLAGEAIPHAARVVALADVYDTLRRQRPHKPAMSHAQAAQVILQESPGAFDPQVLRVFAALQDRFQRIFAAVAP
jgi:response regulator RpfG family c-di-GMP phosphodiesterase